MANQTKVREGFSGDGVQRTSLVSEADVAVACGLASESFLRLEMWLKGRTLTEHA